MPRAVCGNRLLNTALFHHGFQFLTYAPVVDLAKYRLGIFLWEVLVAFYDLKWNVQQFDLIGYARFMTLTHDPLVTVDLYDIVRCQFFDKRSGKPITFKSTNDRAVKFMNTKRSRMNARLASSNSCVITVAAQALIGIAYHFSRDKSLTVRQVLVVLDDLCLDVIEVAVYLQRFLAAALGTVALHVPHRKWNTHLATELRLRSVNCHTSHNRDNPVLLLALVGIKEDVEC